MAEAYKKVGWQDFPSQQTPLNAENLGQMDDGIKENRDLLIEAMERLDSMPSKLSELASDSTHRTVTDAEKSTWNAKSNFSGSYNDLTNKPAIPTIPTSLKNPYSLTIALGSDTYTYDGSKAVSITIADGNGVSY